VAVDPGDVVVGFAIAREVDNTIYLQEMDVDPAHGRRGIGAALVKTVTEWARLHDYHAVSLSTFRDLPWNTPFYAKLGFRILDESELTLLHWRGFSKSFQEIRQQELESGLPISERVIMYCQI
jgi:GNAT superfamily N-acetyltransferase